MGILSAETLTLAWDENDPAPAGYLVRYGLASGIYDQSVDAGTETTATLSDLDPGIYYAAVFAYEQGGLESEPSNEISFTVDEEPPTFAGVPSDIVTVPDPGGSTKAVSWIEPTASDDVGVTVFGSSHAPGATFPAGTTTVTYFAEDAVGNRTEVSFDVFVGGLELWRDAVFGAAKDNPLVAGDLVDPDGDRWPNLLEYIMGRDPMVADSDTATRVDANGAGASFEFSRIAGIPDVVLVVESSPQLGGTWSPVATLRPGQDWSLDAGGVTVSEVELSGMREVTLSRSLPPELELLRLTLVIEDS